MASSDDPYSAEKSPEDISPENGLKAADISLLPEIAPKSKPIKEPKQPIPPSGDDFFLPDLNGDVDENEPYLTNSDLKP